MAGILMKTVSPEWGVKTVQKSKFQNIILSVAGSDVVEKIILKSVIIY